MTVERIERTRNGAADANVPFGPPGADVADRARDDQCDYRFSPISEDTDAGNPGYKGVVLVLADIAALLLTLFIGLQVADAARRWIMPSESILPITPDTPTLLIIILAPLLLIPTLCFIWGHYTRHKPHWYELQDVLKACVYAMCLTISILFAIKADFSRAWFLTAWSMMPFAIVLARRIAKRQLISSGRWFRPTVVVGTGRNAMSSARAIHEDSSMGQRIVGFIGDARIADTSVANQLVLRLSDSGESGIVFLKQHPEYDVVFAPDSFQEMLSQRRMLDHAISERTVVKVVPPLDGLPIYGSEFIRLFRHDIGLLYIPNNLRKRWAIAFKRGFDVVVSSLLIVLFSPVMLCLYFLVRSDGGKAIYASQRIGLDGESFGCLKFRSMIENADSVLEEYLANDETLRKEWSETFKLKHDPRVTRIGDFLRKTSLDELPQLINVLRGEMSLVGPRPILPDERLFYGSDFSYYAETRPGITGLWQISGRSSLTMQDRMRLNVWYARNWSLWTDIVILARTIPTVLKGGSAY